MKKCALFTWLVLVICAFCAVTCAEGEHWVYQAVDLGSCRQMVGDITLYVVFTDTYEGSWDEEAVAEHTKIINQALDFLEEQALSYGSWIRFSVQFFNSKVHTEEIFEHGDEFAYEALLTAGLPYETDTDFYETNGIPVLFALNHGGRSFKGSANNARTEYMVCFDEDMETYCHELLHMYGAADYYIHSEAGAAAEECFPDSIMLRSESGTKVDPLTAYLIGWTDELTDDAKAYLERTAGITHEELQKAATASVFTGSRKEKAEDFVYNGSYVDGLFEGNGIYQYNNGESSLTYVGGFANGYFDGWGVTKYGDGGTLVTYPKGDNESFALERRVDGSFEYGSYDENGFSGWRLKKSAEGTISTGNIHCGHETIVYTSGQVRSFYCDDGIITGCGINIVENGEFYTGECSGDDRSGWGTYIEGSRLMAGNWKENDFTGYGAILHTNIPLNRNVYTGEVANGVRNGYGVVVYERGKAQSGLWENGTLTDAAAEAPEGFVQEINLEQKSYYIGMTAEGDKDGFGTYAWTGGDRYFGEWEQGQRTGYGTYLMNDGTIYSGMHVDNQGSGLGSTRDLNGKITYGQWDGWNLVGDTYLEYVPGNNGYVYVGGNKSDKNSTGTQFWGDGAIYCGEWGDGNYNGVGLLEDLYGDIYIGAFDQNCYHGKGVMLYQDGKIFMGTFEDNHIDGDGYLITADGHIYAGFFRGLTLNGTYTHTTPEGKQTIESWVNGELVE